jgi:menaquinone-dependent protoporphyrinogen oxidase
MQILVGYASVAGSTKEVAAHLAAQLAERGSTVTCVPIGTSPDPAGFDAVVVGSAVHGQAWLPEAVAWLRTSRHVLAGRPIWAFSVGMPAAPDDRSAGSPSAKGPRSQQRWANSPS